METRNSLTTETQRNTEKRPDVYSWSSNMRWSFQFLLRALRVLCGERKCLLRDSMESVGAIGAMAVVFICASVSAAPTSTTVNVDSVALLPRRTDKALLDLIRENAVTSASLSLQVTEHCTLGDKEQVDALADELASRPDNVIIFMDTASAQSLADRLKGPRIYVTRSAATSNSQAASAAPVAESRPPSWVVETLPHSDRLADLVARLSPKPARLGLVYNQSEPSNELFVKSVREQCEKMDGKLKIIECPIPPGACRNANEVRSVMESALPELGKDDPLAIVPGPNSLKFAYVIAQVASERGLGLIGLGEWQGGPPAISLEVAPEAVAAGCLKALHCLAAGGAASASEPLVITPPCSVRMNEEKMKALGWKVSDGMRIEETRESQEPQPFKVDVPSSATALTCGPGGCRP